MTEKIFDCFFAGIVPIYYGAPNIEEYIPKNTFINFRDFKNYKELDLFLKSVDEDAYNLYMKNIRIFLNSDKFYKFSQENFTDTIISILKDEFKQI